jgi:hypothetical protein
LALEAFELSARFGITQWVMAVKQILHWDVDGMKRAYVEDLSEKQVLHQDVDGKNRAYVENLTEVEGS